MSGEKRVVITRTPFRLSFAGGGTDIPEYYNNYGNGAVVSGAMNKYMFISASQYFFKDKIRIHYVRTENDIDNVNDIKHPAIRECLKLMKIGSGVQISSIADIPSKGTGIGSSSSFTVGLLNALHRWKREKVGERQLAEEAVYVERTALKEAGGKQDQYVAAFGGLLFMEFLKDGRVNVRHVKMSKKDLGELEKHLLLIYTGSERSAGALEAKKAGAFGSHVSELKMMADLAYKQVDAFEDGRWRE
ncbi:MAG: kinase, partial [Candidatus Micrarchaeota archaeon]|nr:kinase [Candidatus Micrarchaeota archaeon]